jgi:hypothetical protein
MHVPTNPLTNISYMDWEHLEHDNFEVDIQQGTLVAERIQEELDALVRAQLEEYEGRPK